MRFRVIGILLLVLILISLAFVLGGYKEQRCMDSDNGLDWMKKGNTTVVSWWGTVVMTEFDECRVNPEGKVLLNERACMLNDKGELQRAGVVYECYFGCKDGACVQHPPYMYFTAEAGAGKYVSIPVTVASTSQGELQSLVLALESGDRNKVLAHYVIGEHRNEIDFFLKRHGPVWTRQLADYYRTAKLVNQTGNDIGDFAYFEYDAMFGDQHHSLMTMVKTGQGYWAVLRSG